MQASRVPKPIAKQLLEAFEGSGLTLDELVAKARLECDFTSLSRKLHGKQILTTGEAEAIAQALKHSIAWEPKARGAS